MFVTGRHAGVERHLESSGIGRTTADETLGAQEEVGGGVPLLHNAHMYHGDGGGEAPFFFLKHMSLILKLFEFSQTNKK